MTGAGNPSPVWERGRGEGRTSDQRGSDSDSINQGALAANGRHLTPAPLLTGEGFPAHAVNVGAQASQTGTRFSMNAPIPSSASRASMFSTITAEAWS